MTGQRGEYNCVKSVLIMMYFSKPFNKKNTLDLPCVTREYLLSIGVKEEVYYDEPDNKHDTPIILRPIDTILDRDYDCIVPVWKKNNNEKGDFLLARKDNNCNILYLTGEICANFQDSYITIIPPINSDEFVVQNKDGKWGVVCAHKSEPIVEFGKYQYLWGFDNGLCLVEVATENKLTFSNRGIINKIGEEVVKPYTYSDIYSFYGKETSYIIVQHGNIKLFLEKENDLRIIQKEKMKIKLSISKNEDNKYGIVDDLGKCIIPFQYDIILGIYEDSWAIVGYEQYLRKRRYSEGYYYEGMESYLYKTYKYGIISLTNEILFPIKYESIFREGDIVYASFQHDSDDIAYNNLPVYKMTTLGQYIWETSLGVRYIDINDKDVVRTTCDIAILRKKESILKMLSDIVKKDRPSKNSSPFSFITISSDGTNITTNSDGIKIFEQTNENEVDFHYPPSRDDILSNKVPKNKNLVGWPHTTPKWKRFTSYFKDKQYFLCFDGNVIFSYTDGKHDDFSNWVINDEFLIVTVCGMIKPIRIYSSKGKLLLENINGINFDLMGAIYDRLLIDKEYILDSDGNKYYLKEEFKNMSTFAGDIMGYIPFYKDSEGKMNYYYGVSSYHRYYRDEKLGYLDRNGEVVIPPIFPCPLLKDSFSESYKKKQSRNDISDAFDDELGAEWGRLD